MKFVDPDGREIVFVIGKNNYTYNGKSLTDSEGKKINISNKYNVGKIIQAYNDMLNSGDEVLSQKVNHLIESEQIHYIEIDIAGQRVNSVSPGSKNTTISEDEKAMKEGKRMGSRALFRMSGDRKKDSEIVAHEMQHQFDFDTGNMRDDTGKSDASNPVEIRAVNTENRMKKINNTGKRDSYGGKRIDPKLLE